MNYLVLLVFLVGLGIFLFSTFFAPPHLASEILLSPHWVLGDFDTSTLAGTDEEGWVPLLLNEELLFVHQNAVVGVRERQAFHISYNRNAYINTTRNHRVFVLKNQYGDILQVFESSSFPLLFDTAVAAISPDGLGLELWDREGNLIFSRRWASIISAVDLVLVDGQLFTAVGLLDGRVYLFAGEEELFSPEPDNSSIAVLYNLALHHSVLRRKQFINLFTVEGYDPAVLRKRSFSLTAQGELLPPTVSTVSLHFQPLGPTKMAVLDGGGAVLLEESERVLKYSFGEAGAEQPVIINGVGNFRDVWLNNDLGIYSFGDSSQSRIEIQASDNVTLFFSQKPFAMAAEMIGDILYVRNTRILSAYILEEG